MNNTNAQAAPAIFGLRYLEDDAADIHDIVGCAIPIPARNDEPPVLTATGCDDQDH